MMRRLETRGEEGIALVTAVISVMLMITLSAVALQEAIGGLRTSTHETNVKRAQQAAESAVQAAAYRAARLDLGESLKINLADPTTVLTQNCLAAVAGVGGVDVIPMDPSTPRDPQGNQWCVASAPETSTDGSTFSYRISALARVGTGSCGSNGLLNLDRWVVGTGTAGGVTRRVRVKLESQIALLSGAAVQSGSRTAPLTLAGTARILGDASTNASITANGVNVISGTATVGAGATISGVAPLTTAQTCTPFTIPDVDRSAVATSNDNNLRDDKCVDALALIPVGCTSILTGTTGGVTYNPLTRTLDVFGNGRTILTGSNYSFCSIRVRGSGILEIPNSNPVTRIFLEDPASCPGVPGAGQITVDGQARIVNCHLQTQPETLQIYASGSTAQVTTQTFAAAGLVTGTLRSVLCGANVPVVGEPMTIIAPHSTVELGGTTTIAGQVIADVVHLSGAAAVNPINALVNINQLGENPVLPLYQPKNYVQCTGRPFSALPASSPAEGC